MGRGRMRSSCERAAVYDSPVFSMRARMRRLRSLSVVMAAFLMPGRGPPSPAGTSRVLARGIAYGSGSVPPFASVEGPGRGGTMEVRRGPAPPPRCSQPGTGARGPVIAGPPSSQPFDDIGCLSPRPTMARTMSPNAKRELLPGMLDMLILRTLSVQPMHGYGIAQHLQRLSDDVIRVEEGTLYPALQRIRQKGWIRAEWAQKIGR